MCNCVYNKRGFLELECHECELAAEEEAQRAKEVFFGATTEPLDAPAP